LITSAASPFLPGRNGPSSLVAPMQGAAQGSLFWLEFDASFNLTRVMRRNVGGQISMLIDGVDSHFAVDNDKVFCEQGGRLVQVSIDGGPITVLADASQAHSPWGIAVDANYVYWSTTRGEIMRLARSGSGSPGAAPVITTHPANQTVAAGQSASFTVAATGNPTPTYQWQVSAAGGAFTNVPGSTPYAGTATATLTVASAPANLTGSLYRAVATNTLGSATSNASTLTVTTTPSCTYGISVTAAFFGSTGGTGSVTVTPSASTCAWTAASNASFLTVTAGASGTGTGTVSYAVGSLASGTRTASLTIADKTLTMTQSASDTSGCSFSLSATSAAFDLSGGTGTVTVTPSPSSCAWTAVSNAQFISVTGGSAGTGTRAVTYAVSSASAARAGTLTIAGRTVTVMQSSTTCTYDLSPGSASFDAFPLIVGNLLVGNISVSVNAGSSCAWTALSNDSFITVTAGSSGTGNGTVSYTVASNQSLIPRFPAKARIGTLTVADHTFIVAQEGEVSCTYVLSPASTQAPNAGGTYSVAVSTTSTNSDCSWTALSHDSWLTILSGSTGSLSGTTMLSVAPNTAGSQRTGTLVIAGKTFTVVQSTGPVMALDKGSLAFSATSSGAAFTSQTSAQTVRLTQTGAGTVSWIAGGHYPWIRVSPSSGTGSATLTISVQFADGLTALQADDVFLLFTGAGNTAGPIRVTLNTLSPTAAAPPQGFFDTPIDGSTGVTGSIPVTGWAVDDVEIVGVRILRDPVAGEPQGSLVFIGNAVLVEGARPDVAAAYPASPRSTRAGWGYLMLTNFLPNLGNGTFKLTAIADDADGHSTILGTKIITCANAMATAPMGAIDTPTQGATVSGTVTNFGWVLSPGTRRADPPGGGTVRVVIDGAVLGAVPSGWTSRTDLTALFPAAQFPGIVNALGVATFDSATLANGLHTLSWLVTDNLGSASGIGSRYFTVSNGSLVLDPAQDEAASAALTSAMESAPRDGAVLRGRRGFSLETPLQVYAPRDGRATVHAEELDRIELQLGEGPGQSHAGYLRAAGGLAPLPIGSSLDESTGAFTWAPGVGFVGSYDFVFLRLADGRAVATRDVRVVINPKGSNRVGPQVVIDTAGGILAGWAADLDSTIDTGVDTAHVWAYPVDGADPTFIGVASYGGLRPDVAAVYGERFANSGYGIRVQGLPPGTYDLAVFAYSTVRGGFVPARTVRVTLR